MGTAFNPISLIPSGLSSVVGLFNALFGGSTNTSNQSGSTSGTETNSSSSGNQSTELSNFINFLQSMSGATTGTGTTTTTPNLSPQSQQFLSNLTSGFNNLTTPALQGYQNSQIANVNANANAQSQALNQIMASRGLSTSPVAATAQANANQNRINQINAVQAQTPLLQQQMTLQNLEGATSLAGMLPGLSGGTTQQQTAGTSTQQASGQSSQNQTSQAWQNLWNYLNSASGQNSQSYGTQSSSGLLSDKRLKKNIKPVEQAIDKISKLRATTWNWKEGKSSRNSEVGFIAQEVEKVLPDLVNETDEFKIGKPLKTINYIGIIPYLVNAVQELDARTA